AGHSQAVQLAKKLLGSLHLLIEGRLGEPVEQGDNGGLASGDSARGLASRVFFELATGGKVGVGGDVERLQASWREDRPSITKLYVNRIIGCGGHQLGLGRAAAL